MVTTNHIGQHTPITESVNRLIERAGFTGAGQWYTAPAWVQTAMWDYAKQIAARWARRYGCHCQD